MIVAIVVSSLSLLTNTIGLAIPYWRQGSVEWRGKTYAAHVGLWKFCGKHGEEKTKCVPIEEVKYEHGSYLKATRVAELLGMSLIALALLGAFLKLTAMPHQTKVAVAAAILAFIADGETIPGWFLAVRAMELIGMILMASAVCSSILKMTTMRGNANLVVAAAILALLAGISMLIGTIVFGAKTKQASTELAKHLHAGFGLCIAAGILAIIDTVVLFIHKSKMREASYSSI